MLKLVLVERVHSLASPGHARHAVEHHNEALVLLLLLLTLCHVLLNADLDVLQRQRQPPLNLR